MSKLFVKYFVKEGVKTTMRSLYPQLCIVVLGFAYRLTRTPPMKVAFGMGKPA